MGWEISKEFACAYGHRVWSQTLNTEYSIDGACVCRHLHGHQMKLLVHLEGDELSNGMVTDFKHLNWFKKWVDDVLDHKFILDRNDPLFDTLLPDFQGGVNSLTENREFLKMEQGGYWIVNPDCYKDFDTHLQEMYEGYVIVDFLPTSENLSKWMFDIVQEKMSKINVKVSRVEFYETPKSRSQYLG